MATRFWVGGTGNWSDATNHWATTSGGAPGAGNLPTASDNVIFDSASHTTNYTVTLDTVNKLCLDATFSAPASGNITLAGIQTWFISGSLTLYSGLIRTYTGNITFNATSGTKTITSNGVSLASGITFNGVGGTFQLVDTLTTTGSLTRTNGTFDANSQTVVLNGAAQGVSGFSGTSSFYNLTRTSTATKTDFFQFSTNTDVSNNLVINGNSSINRILVQSVTIGTARTVTAANVSVSNADFRDIVGAGAGSWNLSAITGLSGDCGGNSGITFTTPATQTNTGATGNWSDVTKWTSRVPLPQDDVIINTGTGTITGDMPRLGKSIDFTGFTGTFTPSTVASIFGSLTLVSGMTLTASTSTYTFEGRSTYTLTSAGKTWGKSIIIIAPGGTLTLQDDLTLTTGSSGIFTLTSGTFNANNFNVTARAFTSNNSNTRVLTMGSGTWTLGNTVASDTTIWDIAVATGLTLNANTSTIKITSTVNNLQSFAGGGKTYNNLWYSRGASTGNHTISGSNTFNDFKDDGTAAHSILFQASTTQTVTTFTVSGTAGNLITLDSTSATDFNLVKSGGGTISCDYLSIQNSDATPASTWYAGTHSTNNQGATGGTGWIFTDPPAPSTRRVFMIS